MGAGAGKPLTAGEVGTLLDRLEQTAGREACWSCKRLQDFVAQLEADAAEDAKSLLETYEVRREKLHGGLGCEPCEPAAMFAEYRRQG